MSEEARHDILAARLYERVVESGVSSRQLRERALSVGMGQAELIPEPYETLARQISDDSYRVSDEQMAAVRDAAGSDKSAFEVVMAASIGAGLRRWEAAARAIEEATGEAS